MIRIVRAEGWSQEKAWRVALKATALMLQEMHDMGGRIESVEARLDGEKIIIDVKGVDTSPVLSVNIKGTVEV